MNLVFETDDSKLIPAVTTAQMREVDRIAIEETGPNLYQMMENAGRNLATLALDLLGSDAPSARILVLAGAGGNGGGGICAGRHLANKGAKVALCLAQPDRLGEVPGWQYKVFLNTSGRALSAADVANEMFDMILDALIGYSLQASPHRVYADLISWANASGAPIVALDVPSGVDSTTGATPGVYISAVATMTLALPKTGLLPNKTGSLYLADIGIPIETYRRLGLSYAPQFGNRYIVPLHVFNTEGPCCVK